jgi:hypothetical protein
LHQQNWKSSLDAGCEINGKVFIIYQSPKQMHHQFRGWVSDPSEAIKKGIVLNFISHNACDDTANTTAITDESFNPGNDQNEVSGRESHRLHKRVECDKENIVESRTNRGCDIRFGVILGAGVAGAIARRAPELGIAAIAVAAAAWREEGMMMLMATSDET